MSGMVEGALCGGAVLLAAIVGYLAGIRRRPPRRGSVQLRPPRHRR